MYGYVHVDGKWFPTMKDYLSIYLAPDKLKTHRTAKGRSFIEIMMFLYAVALTILTQDLILIGKLAFDHLW